MSFMRGQVGRALPLLFGLGLVLLLFFGVAFDIINNAVIEASVGSDEIVQLILSATAIFAFFALIWTFISRIFGAGLGS